MAQPLRFPHKLSEGVRDLLEGMLSISESRRLSYEEVKKLLMLEQKQVGRSEEKSYHWSVVRELALHEADWHSKARFKMGYEELEQ